MDLTNIKNVIFTENKAYAGGALYSNNNKNCIFFNINDKDNIKFLNNTSESHGKEYATRPYIIKLVAISKEQLNIASGEAVSFKFSLFDEYNQLIIDISRFYPNIYIYAFNNDNNLDEIPDNYIIGNICNFSNGKFIYLYIYIDIFFFK